MCANTNRMSPRMHPNTQNASGKSVYSLHEEIVRTFIHHSVIVRDTCPSKQSCVEKSDHRCRVSSWVRATNQCDSKFIKSLSSSIIDEILFTDNSSVDNLNRVRVTFGHYFTIRLWMNNIVVPLPLRNVFHISIEEISKLEIDLIVFHYQK